MRLDLYILKKFNLKSRSFAETLIKKGKVSVDGKTVVKPSFEVADGFDIVIDEDENYASQGAYKLLKAINEFNLNLSGKTAADFGCSNGGFTDVMLRAGVKEILAVDVGECALPQNLLDSGKVKFLRANVRELPPDVPKFDFISCDVSFISLKLILPSIFKTLKTGGEAVVLIKPQFEAGKAALSKKGIVLSAKDRMRAVDEIKDFASSIGFNVKSVTEAPIFYADKNVEYLAYLIK